MDEKFSKEHINEIVLKTVEELNFNFTTQFTQMVATLDEDIRNNPVYREIIALSIAQTNSVKIMTEVLYKLLNE